MFDSDLFSTPQSTPTIWTVSELNRSVARCLETNFPSLWVKGEIRGLTMATSGHWYFTLKDEFSEVSCAMFAGANRRVGFRPKTGDHVEVRGRVSLYAPRGSYQLVVDAMRHEGLGALYARYLELKARLQAEGLFDASRKKRIPRINFKIAVVTSLKAAALYDVIKTLRLRAPYADLTVYPTAVQGVEAPLQIVNALQQAENSDAGVVLLVRGGGSLQDLWAFNDERVAWTIAKMTKPLISGVGHESDETIVDYVADLRAATPTAAAQAATESVEVLYQDVHYATQNLESDFRYRLDALKSRLKGLSQAIPNPKLKLASQAEHFARQKELLKTFFVQRQLDPKVHSLELTNKDCDRLLKTAFEVKEQRLVRANDALVSPQFVINVKREQLKQSANALSQIHRTALLQARSRWEKTASLMIEGSPETILKKGYAYVTDDGGQIVKNFEQAKTLSEVTIHWIDGVMVAKPLKAKTIKAND